MAAIFAFRCTCCGNLHEGSPSFAYASPQHYNNLDIEQQNSVAKLSSDLCRIDHADHSDYFVRCVLEIPIHAAEQPFTWGVWVSASETSFTRYVETYDAPIEGSGFFGWLCNRLPHYPDTLSLMCDVYVQTDGRRPKVKLHCGDQATHPLVIDQQNGLRAAQAQELAELLLHETAET